MRFLLMIAGAAWLFIGTACGPDQNSKTGQRNLTAEDRHEMEVYKMATSIGDVYSSAYALYSQLARDTTRYELYDSLSRLYYAAHNYPLAIRAGERNLIKYPDNVEVLRIIAQSYQGLNAGQYSLRYYRKLAEMTKEPLYDYQIGMEYYNGGDLEVAEEQAKKLLANPANDSAKVAITFGPQREYSQIVPIKAVAENLLGAVRIKQKKYGEAREHFNNALKLDSTYLQPKENLKTIQNLK